MNDLKCVFLPTTDFALSKKVKSIIFFLQNYLKNNICTAYCFTLVFKCIGELIHALLLIVKRDWNVKFRRGLNLDTSSNLPPTVLII